MWSCSGEVDLIPRAGKELELLDGILSTKRGQRIDPLLGIEGQASRLALFGFRELARCDSAGRHGTQGDWDWAGR